MESKPLPPIDELRRRLRYDPGTGKIYWIVSARHGWAGKEAGKRRPDGYMDIKFDGRLIRNHRVAWALHTGNDPHPMEIDHANGNRSDNRIVNLRPATHSQNNGNSCVRKNNKSGVKGIWWNKKLEKWQVSINTTDGKKHLGCYKNKIFAGLVYARAAKIYFGEFWSVRPMKGWATPGQRSPRSPCP